MPIIPAAYKDLLPASKVLASAFKDEYLFGTYMHPNLSQYPEDMYLHFLHKLRIAYVSAPDHVIILSCKKNDQGQEQITGVAIWHRIRAKPTTSLYANINIKAMEWYNYLESFMYPNRAADPERQAVLAEMWPFMQHHWTGTRSEVWDLLILGVDPNQGGQGFGKQLVEWGFSKARDEGIGCSVVSAEGKDSFYQSRGFEPVGNVRDHGGEGNPLNKYGINGGGILFWDNGRDVSGVKGYAET